MPQGRGFRRQAALFKLFGAGQRGPVVCRIGQRLSGLPGRRQFAGMLDAVLQHARGAPVGAGLQQRLGLLKHHADTAARQARQHAVIGGNMGRQHPGGQTRRACGGRAGCVQYRDLPAAPRQAGRHRGARQPCANHDAARRNEVLRRDPVLFGFPGGLVFALQVVAFGRDAGDFFHHETALRQRVAHTACHRPGGNARAAPAASGHGLEGMHIPDARIQQRAESVKED